jgi:hypothetical protein
MYEASPNVGCHPYLLLSESRPFCLNHGFNGSLDFTDLIFEDLSFKINDLSNPMIR